MYLLRAIWTVEGYDEENENIIGLLADNENYLSFCKGKQSIFYSFKKKFTQSFFDYFILYE